MNNSLHITDVERIESQDMVIYWLGDAKSDRQFGVCFRPCITNIANQGVAESVALALAMAYRQIESIEDQL